MMGIEHTTVYLIVLTHMKADSTDAKIQVHCINTHTFTGSCSHIICLGVSNQLSILASLSQFGQTCNEKVWLFMWPDISCVYFRSATTQHLYPGLHSIKYGWYNKQATMKNVTLLHPFWIEKIDLDLFNYLDLSWRSLTLSSRSTDSTIITGIRSTVIHLLTMSTSPTTDTVTSVVI